MNYNEKPFFSSKPYGYINGAIAAISHPLLSNDQLAKLSDETSANNFYALLCEYGYGDGNRDGSFYKLLDEELAFVVNFLKEHCPSDNILEIFLFEYDIHNLKLLIKSSIFNRNCSEWLSPISYHHADVVKACVSANDYSVISESFAKAMQNIDNQSDPFKISCGVDNAYFSHVLNIIAENNYSFLQKLFTTYAIGRNRCSYARLRNLEQYNIPISDISFLPVDFNEYKQRDLNKTIEQIENETDKTINSLFYEHSSELSIAPLAQYFFSKKSEMRKLALMFVDKQ